MLGKTQKKIYICYDDADEQIAEDVCTALKRDKFECWFRSRNAKSDVLESSRDAISKSNLVVLIYSKNFKQSDFVNAELYAASAKNIPVLVFHIDESRLTDSMEFFLADKPWIDARNNHTDKLDKLYLASSKMLKNEDIELDYRPLKESHSEKEDKKTPSSADNRPLPAYGGDEPYIFISYKHKDHQLVFPLIRQLQDAGFNIWYDEGLSRGKDYDIQIVKRIKNSELFITCMTKSVMETAMDSEDYMIKEASLAINRKKPCLPIILEDVELEGYYIMHFAGLQSIFKPGYENDSMFIAECVRTIRTDFGIEPNESGTKVEGDNEGYRNMPFKPYEGSEPYIFVSYKHSDWKEVYPIINRLHDAGLNIWYDASLAIGMDYDIQIANRISESSLFVTFMTEEVIKGANDEEDYLVKELQMAISLKKSCLPIFLENVPLDGYYMMHYIGRQSIFKYEYDGEDQFMEDCLQAFKDFGFEVKKDKGETRPRKTFAKKSVKKDFPRENAPFKAYDGDEPYIFAGYSHADSEIVYPIIQRLQDEGFNIWYDEGIGRGSMWIDEIARAIEGCSLFAMFLSRNSAHENELCLDELKAAIHLKKEILPIYLDDLSLSGPLMFYLADKKSIFKQEFDDEAFISLCMRAFEDSGIGSKYGSRSAIGHGPPAEGEEHIFNSVEDFEPTEKPADEEESSSTIIEDFEPTEEPDEEEVLVDDSIPDFGGDVEIEKPEGQSQEEEDDSHVKNKPFDAYEGDDPFIFISYKHADWRGVYPIINQLHEKGFNIWYDASLKKGKSFDIQIVKRIKKAALFITFITKTVIDGSEDSEDYLVKELNVAIERKKERMPIFLEDIALDGFYLMHYPGLQSIFRHEFGSNEDMFIDECVRAFKNDFGIEPCGIQGDDGSPVKQTTCKPFQLSCLINSKKNSYNPPGEVIEKLANAIQESYKSRYDKYLTGAYIDEMSKGEIPDAFFMHLDNFRLKKGDFRKEAKNRIRGLHSIGYDVVDKGDSRKEVSGLEYLEEIELAKYNHYQWCEKKTSKGYEYGYEGNGFNDVLISDVGLTVGPDRRSNEGIIAPYRDSLKLWQDLNHDEQKGNIDFVKEIFDFIPSDLKIVSSKVDRNRYNDFLESQIETGEDEIILDSDIIFDTAGPNGIFIGRDDLTIDGQGHTIDAGFLSRIFTITGKNITLKSINFTNALSHSQGGAISILEGASCKFYDCKFENNVSDAKPDSKGNILYSDGGAIYNKGSCSLISCTFKNNDVLGENQGSKDIAPYESFELINCTLDGEINNKFDETTILGIKYLPRNPDCEIYKLTQIIYPHWHPDNEQTELSELSDEDYYSYERIAIRALSIANAAEGKIHPNDYSGTEVDDGELLTFENLEKSSKSYIEAMMNLGWNNGRYDYSKKTIPLVTFGGSLAADREERYVETILKCLKNAGYSIFKD